MKPRYYYQWLILALFMLMPGAIHAAKDSVRVYTKEHPLVYEDAWDLWPYAFLNEQGEPDGFNIDLLKILMEELHIPYVIKMKPVQEAFYDMRDMKSDLMMGLAVWFNDQFGKYNQNVITLFTQSVVSPKKQKGRIQTFHDLADHKVIVWKGSLCHRLMKENGWGENAIPCEDMQEAIKEVSAREEGQIVWNTLSLKWLMNKYKIDNLELTPVDMPHGEYKFMSHDARLLHHLDSVYSVLSSTDRLTPIRNKWFYPERKKPIMPIWCWYVLGALVTIAVLFLFYYFYYRIKGRKVTKELTEHNQRLSQILEESKITTWTYDVFSQTFTWYDNGKPINNLTQEAYSQHFHEGDFEQLMKGIRQLIEQKSESATLEVKITGTEDSPNQERDFMVALSVLRHTKNGKPTVILGTKRDITLEKQQKQEREELKKRYQAMFDSPMVDVVFYDKDGYLTELNQQACETFGCDHDSIIKEHVTFQDVIAIDLEDFDFEDEEAFHATLLLDLAKKRKDGSIAKSCLRNDKMYYEVLIKPVYDDKKQFMGLFSIGRDRTEIVNSIIAMKHSIARVEHSNKELTDYVSNINFILKESGVRMAEYSPLSHTLTILSGINKIQYQLTQARCMSLVDDLSKKKAMHMLTNMDNRCSKSIDTDIRTIIRNRQGEILHLELHLIPSYDEKGEIVSYFGLCRDVSELKATERQLAEESIKAQEVEQAKNSFLQNMSHEIRTPLNAVVGFAELFDSEHTQEDEDIFINEILKNSDYLLHLINNILFLSRLDAGMIEITNQPTDITTLVEEHCTRGWGPYQHPDVRYIVESPLQQFVADVDASNLGLVIEKLTENAAQHTKVGTIRTRYNYIGRRLIITVEDTGNGIDPAIRHTLFQRFVSGSGAAQGGGGLGLPICKELIDKMNGSIEINSEPGEGTTIWVIIPCHASVIKRKLNL